MDLMQWSKVVEKADKEVYALLDNVASGHNLKHIFAAFAGVFFSMHVMGPGNVVNPKPKSS
jgi:hypothetical protein